MTVAGKVFKIKINHSYILGFQGYSLLSQGQTFAPAMETRKIQAYYSQKFCTQGKLCAYFQFDFCSRLDLQSPWMRSASSQAWGHFLSVLDSYVKVSKQSFGLARPAVLSLVTLITSSVVSEPNEIS